MPSINIPITPTGPLLQLLIGVSVPRSKALQAAGQPVPANVQGTFLIDTGASSTCVDPGLVASLSLAPTSAAMVQTPTTNGTPIACNQYDVMIYISAGAGQGLMIEALPILETPLKAQGIDGLVGRDILDNRLFIYNGSLGMFTLSY